MTAASAKLIGLRSMAAYLPEKVVAIEAYQYLQSLVPSFDFFPKQRRINFAKDAAEAQAVAAATEALARAAISANEVDLIISQNLGGQYITPGIGAYVKRALGCRMEITAIDIQHVCAGFLNSCKLAWDAIRAEPETVKNVLIVNSTAWHTGEWGVDASDPSAAVVGDGAAAGIVSARNVQLAFLSYANRTHDEIYEDLVVRVDGPANPELLPERGAQLRDVPVNKAIMRVSENFPLWMMETGKMLPVWLLPAAAEAAGIDPGDIAYIPCHQAQGLTIEIWKSTAQEQLGIDPAKWYHHWDSYGNMGGADSAVNLEHLLNRHGLAAGDKVAYFSPGGGGHSPAMIMERQ